MSFQATVKNPRRYPTLEVALFGGDGAEFVQWATKVLDQGTPQDSARIILKAIMACAYPWIGEREANRLCDDYIAAMMSGWPKAGSGAATTENFQKVTVSAFTAGLVMGSRLGRLNVANAILTGGPTTMLYNDSGLDEGGISTLPSFAKTVFARPVGHDAGITPKSYQEGGRSAAANNSPFKGGSSEFLAELVRQEARRRERQRSQCAAPTPACGDGSEPTLAEVDAAVRALAAEAGIPTGARDKVVGMQFRPDSINRDRIEELFRKGGYEQDAEGMWFLPDGPVVGAPRTGADGRATVEDGFTERPGGGDRATAGEGSNNFSTEKVGPLVTDGAKSEV
jgi:hypothetical protein